MVIQIHNKLFTVIQKRDIHFESRNETPRIKCYKYMLDVNNKNNYSSAKKVFIPKNSYKKNTERSIIFEQES